LRETHGGEFALAPVSLLRTLSSEQTMTDQFASELFAPQKIRSHNWTASRTVHNQAEVAHKFAVLL